MKTAVKEENAINVVEQLLEEIQSNMYAKAKKVLEENITTANDYTTFAKILKEKGGFVKAGWCGSADCEAKIKEETGATIRVLPFEQEEPAGGCVYCGQKAKKTAYFARSY